MVYTLFAYFFLLAGGGGRDFDVFSTDGRDFDAFAQTDSFFVTKLVAKAASFSSSHVS